MSYDPKISDTTESPILMKGTGTPFVSLFDQAFNPIMNPYTGIYLGAYITDFRMIFQERSTEDDLGNQVKFQFDTGDPSAADLDVLQVGSLIYFQYGYIYPNGAYVCGPLLGTKIHQIDPRFDATGVHLSITGIEVGLDLRALTPFTSAQGDLKEFLDNGCGINIPIVIKHFSEPTDGEVD